ncbi:hypothetical protein [Streptomyces sp. NPDC056549]|uniref:hypothetical protein n=1 Tax=Streptomyces sp. NPDC056549 TaxID=3345864 RepID=UPI0036840728
MSAMPIEPAGHLTDRSYEGVVEWLPEDLRPVFTARLHTALPFRVGGVLEHWARVAEAYASGAVDAAMEAAVETVPVDAESAWGDL